jgi:hypothetical protein
MQTAGAVGSVADRRGRRRWGVMALGIVVAGIGLIAVIGGAVASAVETVRSSSDPIAESLTPTPLQFEADDETYIVSIDTTSEAEVDVVTANTNCSIERPDGSTVDLDGSVQAIGETTGTIGRIGTFDGVSGTTTIACTTTHDGVRYFVDDESALHRYGIVAVIAGAVIMVVGTGLILLGVFTYTQKNPGTQS